MKSQLVKINMPALLMVSVTINLALSTAVYAQWGSLGDDRFSSAGAGDQTGANSQPIYNGTPGSSVYSEPSAIKPNQASSPVYTQQPSASYPGLPNPTYMPYVSPGVPNGGFASYAPLAPVPKGIQVNAKGLPPTSLDSFIKESGGGAAYDDEGTGLFGPPPDNDYSEAYTINAGIHGIDNKGLTTGHGSYMPDASGNGWSMSGARDPHPKAKKELARHVAE